MTPEERRKLGQSRRKQVGRQEHSQLNAKARHTPALKLLQQAGKGRVPALLQLKYQLMSDSPFGYFRGAAPVMAAERVLRVELVAIAVSSRRGIVARGLASTRTSSDAERLSKISCV